MPRILDRFQNEIKKKISYNENISLKIFDLFKNKFILKITKKNSKIKKN